MHSQHERTSQASATPSLMQSVWYLHRGARACWCRVRTEENLPPKWVLPWLCPPKKRAPRAVQAQGGARLGRHTSLGTCSGARARHALRAHRGMPVSIMRGTTLAPAPCACSDCMLGVLRACSDCTQGPGRTTHPSAHSLNASCILCALLRVQNLL